MFNERLKKYCYILLWTLVIDVSNILSIILQMNINYAFWYWSLFIFYFFYLVLLFTDQAHVDIQLM